MVRLSEEKRDRIGRAMRDEHKPKNWQDKLYIIIFKADTRAGKAFDVALLLVIVLSILSISMESIASINQKYNVLLSYIEWIITIIFTFEYIIRIMIVRDKRKYITSFFGIVDLLAILPTYLSLFIPGTQFALVLRIFRLLRVFRVLSLGKYIGESFVLWNALKASKYKIVVFLEGVLVVVVIVGTMMYLIEGEASGFDSIPHSIYWSIVTLTTVGFGDIAPITPLGRFVASFLMLLGYGVIAVPTGIVSAELSRPKLKQILCSSCQSKIEAQDDQFCKYCGNQLLS